MTFCWSHSSAPACQPTGIPYTDPGAASSMRVAKRAIDQGVRLATRIEDAAPGSVFGMPVGWQAGALEWLQRNVVKK